MQIKIFSGAKVFFPQLSNCCTAEWIFDLFRDLARKAEWLSQLPATTMWENRGSSRNLFINSIIDTQTHT